MHLEHCFLFILSHLFFLCVNFQFRPLIITGYSEYINTVTSYTFQADRSSTQNLMPTAWDGQVVPQGSTIRISFPIQYQLSGISCDSVIITTQSLSQTQIFTYTTSIVSQQLQIKDIFIAASMYIQNMKIVVSNILNPIPAITTDSFIIYIGNDNSQSSPSSAVTLKPTKLVTKSATFDSKVVNTTGSLILSFSSQNLIRAASNLVVEFPSTLIWARDISPTNYLPITAALNCAGLTGNVKSALSCSGSLSTRQITVFSISGSDIASYQVISLKIGPLFSPPSIQQIDSIKIKTKILHNGNYQQLDSDSVVIRGLQQKSISMTINPLSSMIVNARIGLQFNVILVDTINQNDVIRFIFPSSVGTFTYSIATSSTTGFVLGTPPGIYDSTNKYLDIRQRTTSSQINYALKTISISANHFFAPPSIKAFSIGVQILRNSNLMAQGSTSLNAVVNVYSGSISSTDLNINSFSATSYTISVDIKDIHTSNMYIDILIPTTLTIDPLTITTKTSLSASVVPTLTISSTNNRLITISKLTSSTSNILPQILTITINNLINPSSVKAIGSMFIRTYYSSYDPTDRVSQSTIVSSLTTISGNIAEGNVKLASLSSTNNQLASYTLQFILSNGIELNGYITITFPVQCDISATSSIKMFTDQSIPISQAVQFNPISSPVNSVRVINSVSALKNGQKITLTLSNVRNPTSTKPTQTKQLRIATFNSLSQAIDILTPNNGISLQTTSANLLSSINLLRASTQNDFLTQYTFQTSQQQKYQPNNKLILAIDRTILLPVPPLPPLALTCIDTSTSLTLTCSTISKPLSLNTLITTATFNYISVDIPASYAGLGAFSFKLTNIQNPASLMPFSIIAYTLSQDYLYLYSFMERIDYYQNSDASSMAIPSYGYSVRELGQKTALTFSYQTLSTFSYMLIKFQATLFVVASAICSSIQISDIVCTVIGSNQLKVTSTSLTLLTSVPKLATITLSNLITPTTINVAPLIIKLYTYDTGTYLMSSNVNTIKYQLSCTFPCKSCLSSTQTTSCLSCYQSPISTKIYLNSVDSKCYQDCPDGYNQNIDSFTCQKCQVPCLNCNNDKSNCTKCDSASQFIYLLYTTLTDLSTCIKSCPSKYYPNINSIPTYCQQCQSPCMQCTSPTVCVSCLDPAQVIYNGKCLDQCPVDVTVADASTKTCVGCSTQCKTCKDTPTTCTSCSTDAIFYLSKCLLTCPNNLIKYTDTCVPCDDNCQTCKDTPTTCLTCKKASSSQLFYNSKCSNSCPNFYYPDSNNICLQCTKLTIHCKNCIDEITCRTCDAGYSLLGKNCLNPLPQGYIDIGGVATPCAGDCKTCSITVDACNSCKTMNLNGNVCQNGCDYGETAVSQVCMPCKSPCQTCSQQIYLCDSCYSSTSTFLYGRQCLPSCPDKFYKDTTTSSCAACKSPCQKCSSQNVCLSCLAGSNFLSSTSQCLPICPDGMVGQNKLCVICQAPCSLCSGSKTSCTKCISGYYFYSTTSQCLTLCPLGSIKNEALRICQACESPCQTCQNQTTSCLTCAKSFYFLDNQCLSACPNQYYLSSSSGKCILCSAPCSTCTSATSCTSCLGTLYSYKQSCVATCPQAYGKISNNTCTLCDTNCYSCQNSGACTKCTPDTILFKQQCVTSCPSGYIQSQVNSTNITCVLKQQSDTKLQQALTSQSSQSSLFPLPFTIFGLMILGAGLISKLQNKNTYLIGIAYSIFGILQTLTILYTLYYYYFNYQQRQILIVYLILVGLGIWVFLNVLGIFAHTAHLYSDKKFQEWIKRQQCSKSTVYWIVNIISFIINYKFKLIIFTKLFNFQAFKSQLSSIRKFRIFNAFSFIGIVGQAQLIYTLTRQIISKHNYLSNQLKLIFVDSLIILCLNVVFSIAASWKDDDFFTEEIDGVVINKKVTIDGDFINKKGLKDDQTFYPYYSTRITGEQSHQAIKIYSDIIKQYPDEYSSSLQKITESDKNSKISKTKDKLYFEDEDLSSQTLRYKDQLDQKSVQRKQSIKNQVQDSIFENNCQDQHQDDKDVELDKQSFKFSSNGSEILRKSAKQSQNILCQSPRKKQKMNQGQDEKKYNYSEQQEQQKTMKIKKNQEMEGSASQFNKIMKDKQLKQMLNEDSTKEENISKRKSKQNNQKQKNFKQNNSKQYNSKQNSLKEQHKQIEDQTNQNISPKIATFKFEEISNSLNVESQQADQLKLIYQSGLQSRKIKINSLNSSKTDILIPGHRQSPSIKPVLIDSDSQTVYNQGRLKPQKKDESITKQKADSLMVNISYQGRQNQIDQKPAYNSRKKKYSKQQQNKTKYDYNIGSINNSPSNYQQQQDNLVIEIEHTDLFSSQQQQSRVQQIQKNPLGYSPQSRILDNKQETELQLRSENDSTFLQLNSQIKILTNPNSNLNSSLAAEKPQQFEKILTLQTIEEGIGEALKTNEQRQRQRQIFTNQLKINKSQNYQNLKRAINTQTQKRTSKKLLQTFEREKPVKKSNDIYVNLNLEENEIPIGKRKNSFKRNYPVEEKPNQKPSNRHLQKFDSDGEQEFYNPPSKRSAKKKQENTIHLDTIYQTQKIQTLMPYIPKNNNVSAISKSRPIFKSRHIQFNPSKQRIQTNTLFTEQAKDQSDDFSFHHIQMESNQNQNRTHYAYETIQRPEIGFQHTQARFDSSALSTQILPRPNLKYYESTQKNRSNKMRSRNQRSLDNGGSLINSKSLAIYYKNDQKGNKSKDSRQENRRQRSNEKQSSNDKKTYRSPSKIANSNQIMKNQIQNQRLKQLQKIYLQRLH